MLTVMKLDEARRALLDKAESRTQRRALEAVWKAAALFGLDLQGDLQVIHCQIAGFSLRFEARLQSPQALAVAAAMVAAEAAANHMAEEKVVRVTAYRGEDAAHLVAELELNPSGRALLETEGDA